MYPKKCSGFCKKEKDVSLFPKNKHRKDGIHSVCKECHNKFSKLSRQKNPEAHKLYIQRSLAKDPEHLTRNTKRWQLKHPEKTMLSKARIRAKRKQLECTIQEKDIIIPEFCPILGLKLQRHFGHKTGQDNSPSLDRIDSTKGYIPGNIAVISYRANMIKNAGTLEEHKKIVEWLEKQNL